jgi:hypothetical protein
MLCMVPRKSLLRMTVRPFISHFAIDSDLDAKITGFYPRFGRIKGQYALALIHARLVIVNPLRLGLGVNVVEGEHVRAAGLAGRAGAREDTCALGGAVRGVSAEGAAADKAAPDGEDDAEGHGGGEDSCQAGVEVRCQTEVGRY